MILTVGHKSSAIERFIGPVSIYIIYFSAFLALVLFILCKRRKEIKPYNALHGENQFWQLSFSLSVSLFVRNPLISTKMHFKSEKSYWCVLTTTFSVVVQSNKHLRLNLLGWTMSISQLTVRYYDCRLHACSMSLPLRLFSHRMELYNAKLLLMPLVRHNFFFSHGRSVNGERERESRKYERLQFNLTGLKECERERERER